MRTIEEQDAKTGPLRGRRHKIHPPHGSHLGVADKKGTRVAEAWLAEDCIPPPKISAEFHEYTHISLKRLV